MMKKFWDTIFGLDVKSTMWVEEEDLGKEKLFYRRGKRYYVKIPQTINKRITLRLRGLGKTRGKKTGDVYLHVWLNKGEDVNKSLWLSESSARNGADKKLLLDTKTITMVVPPKSHHGLTIRLKGYGREGSFSPDAPVLRQKKRGNVLVKLVVYPNNITPTYGSFEYLSTENMALEGWVYRKIDEVIQKIGRSALRTQPLQAETIADLFNTGGWKSIFDVLVDHLDLGRIYIEIQKSNSIPEPGRCERSVQSQNNDRIVRYRITIQEQFLENPFTVAAILAHELCHVVYSERVDETVKYSGGGKATLEEEHTVDLLVFMHKIGEFQLRVARDTRLTLGYFNQEVFERMQVIVSRKLTSI